MDALKGEFDNAPSPEIASNSSGAISNDVDVAVPTLLLLLLLWLFIE
jgi:hypothetical protein